MPNNLKAGQWWHAGHYMHGRSRKILHITEYIVDIGDRMVGYVCDPENPVDKETGYDNWITEKSFNAWIQRTAAFTDDKR